MRKFFLLITLILLSTLASAQYTYQLVARNLTAANNATSGNIIGSGAAFHNLTWNVSGTVSTCSVRVDSSVDGITWNTGDVIGATTCTSNGNTLSASHVVNYVRINLVTFTGTNPVFTANVSGYIIQPSGGGTVTSVTCGTGLSGGTITATGTCAIATTGVTAASYTNANITVNAQGQVTAASNGSAGGGCPTGINNGGLCLLEEHTASASAELDFTTCISATYDMYEVDGNQVILSGANHLLFQVSTNGGSSYDATSGHYAWGNLEYANTGAGFTGTDSDTNIDILGRATNVTANYNNSETFVLDNPAGSTFKHLYGNGFTINNGDTNKSEGTLLSGVYLQTTAYNAFRLIPNTGTITSGTFRCYGKNK